MTIGQIIGLVVIVISIVANIFFYDNPESYYKIMMTLIVVTLVNILIEISK